MFKNGEAQIVGYEQAMKDIFGDEAEELLNVDVPDHLFPEAKQKVREAAAIRWLAGTYATANWGYAMMGINNITHSQLLPEDQIKREVKNCPAPQTIKQALGEIALACFLIGPNQDPVCALIQSDPRVPAISPGSLNQKS